MFMYIFVGRCVSSFSVMQLSKLLVKIGEKVEDKKIWENFVYEVFKIFLLFLFCIEYASYTKKEILST